VPFLNCDVRFTPDSDQTADIEQGRGRANNGSRNLIRLPEAKAETNIRKMEAPLEATEAQKAAASV
jgi:hypothetical protein